VLVVVDPLPEYSSYSSSSASASSRRQAKGALDQKNRWDTCACARNLLFDVNGTVVLF